MNKHDINSEINVRESEVSVCEVVRRDGRLLLANCPPTDPNTSQYNVTLTQIPLRIMYHGLQLTRALLKSNSLLWKGYAMYNGDVLQTKVDILVSSMPPELVHYDPISRHSLIVILTNFLVPYEQRELILRCLESFDANYANERFK